MAPKIRQRLSIAAVAAAVAIAAGTISLWGKASTGIDKRIEKVAKEMVQRELKDDLRDLKIMIQYNKMQAMRSEETRKMWDQAIDLIDNGGRVK